MDPKRAFVTFCYWRLFLMQSKNYKDLCRNVEMFDLNSGDRKDLLTKNPYDDIDYILYEKFIDRYKAGANRFSCSDGPDVDMLISVYTMFQDVFSDNV